MQAAEAEVAVTQPYAIGKCGSRMEAPRENGARFRMEASPARTDGDQPIQVTWAATVALFDPDALFW